MQQETTPQNINTEVLVTESQTSNQMNSETNTLAAKTPSKAKQFFLILGVVLGIATVFTAIFIATKPRYDMKNPQAVAENLQEEVVSTLELITNSEREAEFIKVIQQSTSAATGLFDLEANVSFQNTQSKTKIDGVISQSNNVENLSFSLNILVETNQPGNELSSLSIASDFSSLYINYKGVNEEIISRLQSDLKNDTWYKIALTNENKQEILGLIKELSNPETLVQLYQSEQNQRIYKSALAYLKGKQILVDGKYTQDKTFFGKNTGCADYNLDLGILAGNTKLPLELCLDSNATTVAIKMVNPVASNRVANAPKFDVLFSYTSESYAPVEMPKTFIENASLTDMFNQNIEIILPSLIQTFRQGSL